MSDITKEYSNGEITIVWKPGTCIHSTKCWKGESGLLEVFNPRERTWINPNGANTERIIEQIKQCPSGALSFYYNDKSSATIVEEIKEETIVEVTVNGPLMVYGNLEIKHPDGKIEKRNKVTALCRCGQSSNKPFCDGTHRKVDFKG